MHLAEAQGVQLQRGLVRAPRSHLVRGKEADEAAHKFVTDETRWPILETSLKVGTVVLKRRGEDETGTQVDEGQLMPRDPGVSRSGNGTGSSSRN